ncbi:MAG: protein kinase [Candidatus Micrarchaeota archaeon]
MVRVTLEQQIRIQCRRGTALPQAQSLVLLGRYEIKETFDRGQNGTVYKAFDTRTGQFVGIKEVKDDGSPQAKHTKREFQIGQRLNHPGISKYYESQIADGNIYVVREWGEGQTLSEIGTINPDQKKEIMRQVLDIVEYAHGQRIVLRDLKASNISIDEHGDVKLFEIGGAIPAGEREERDQLSTLGVAGTFGPTSPETFYGSTNSKGDIWSLGYLLAELCI